MTSRILKHPVVKFGAWWIFWTITGTLLIGSFDFGWAIAFTDAAVTQLDWTIAGYALSLVLRYYRPSARNLLNVLLLSVVLAGLFTFLILYWALPEFVGLVGGDARYDTFLEESLPLRFVISWMQMLFIAALSWIWYFVEEQQESEKRRSDIDKLSREAELSRLRQQLQPHFLFNSLNSINALVGTQPELARRMIQQLSDFLRGTVKKDDGQLVTLEDELQHLGLYLDIEKVRFGYRLRSVIDADEASRTKKLPSLLLQPIVENAIKFGLYDTVGEIMISISARSIANELVIRVTNPFDPETAQPKQGTGFGLNSISRRLYLLYSQNGLLETKAQDALFVTTVKVPQL